MKSISTQRFALSAGLWLSLVTLSSHAQEPASMPTLQSHSTIYTQVTNLVKQKADQKLFNTEIVIKKLSPRLKLPNCSQPLNLYDRNDTDYAGRMTISVSCSQPKWRVFVPVTVNGDQYAVKSTKGILRGAVIKSEDVDQVLLPYKEIPRGSAVDPTTVIGMRTKKAIPANKILKVRELQPPYWVFKNQPVNIITRIGAIEVKTTGEALEDAVELEQVPVKNLSSEKILKGIVIAPNTVLIP